MQWALTKPVQVSARSRARCPSTTLTLELVPGPKLVLGHQNKAMFRLVSMPGHRALAASLNRALVLTIFFFVIMNESEGLVKYFRVPMLKAVYQLKIILVISIS